MPLTRTNETVINQRDNLYTDSKYAFLITHTHCALLKEGGFLINKDITKPIFSGLLTAKLSEALQLLAEVAIIYCQGMRPPQT